jgi:hypothetical protein
VWLKSILDAMLTKPAFPKIEWYELSMGQSSHQQVGGFIEEVGQ